MALHLGMEQIYIFLQAFSLGLLVHVTDNYPTCICLWLGGYCFWAIFYRFFGVGYKLLFWLLIFIYYLNVIRANSSNWCNAWRIQHLILYDVLNPTTCSLLVCMSKDWYCSSCAAVESLKWLEYHDLDFPPECLTRSLQEGKLSHWSLDFSCLK